MPFFVGYFLSLTRPNSNLMWHDVFVTAPLFRHWLQCMVPKFWGNFSFFWLILWRGEPRSFICDHPPFDMIPCNKSQIVSLYWGFDSHQHHQYKVIHCKYCLKLEYQLTLHNSHYLALCDAGLVLNRHGRTWLTTTRAHLPTAHSSQIVSSASTYNLSDVHS
jgi:hypothetical protein